MGVILVFDLTEEQSFENVRNWLRQIKMHASENICKVLVGNKSDMQEARVVTEENINEFAKEIDIEYFEASAKNNTNIAEAFSSISKSVKERFFANLPKGGSVARSVKLDNPGIDDTKSGPKCC